MANEKTMKFATRAIHGGQSPEPVTGAVMPPIFTSSTYAQESPGQHKGFEYSRSHNPTRFAWERSVASLEGGKQGLAFASGMAATSTILELLDSGDHVVAPLMHRPNVKLQHLLNHLQQLSTDTCCARHERVGGEKQIFIHGKPNWTCCAQHQHELDE